MVEFKDFFADIFTYDENWFVLYQWKSLASAKFN